MVTTIEQIVKSYNPSTLDETEPHTRLFIRE